MSQENVEMVRHALDGWNREDFDAWTRDVHPECEWYSDVALHMGGEEAVFRGRDGLRRYWDEWQTVWRMRIEIIELRDLGDRVFGFVRVRTHGQASGIDLEQEVGYVFRIEDGKVREGRSYLDPQEARTAAGLSE